MSWARLARRSHQVPRGAPCWASTKVTSRLFTSHYERLGVPIHATRGEIRSAFIRLAKVHHPDVSASQDSESEFVALKQAFDVLNDPHQRELYTSQLSRRGTQEESYYQPPSSDDRSRQRRTLRRAGKDLITRGMESWEQLEKELEEALDRAYHGPLFDPTEEQAFPPCFELEEANSLRDANGTVEVLHVVCGRSFLGHVLWNPATAGPYTLELLTGSSSASLTSVARATRDEDGNVVFEARHKGEDEWRRVARLRGSDSTLLSLEEKERERETHKVLRSRAPGVQSLLFYSKLGFLEFRGDRAWLPPSSLWVWEPRDTRFSTGGWYFETNHQGHLTHARFSSMRRAGRGKALGEAMADMARDWGFGGPENGKDDQPQAAPQPSVKEGSCISPRGGSSVDQTRKLDASIVILLAGFMTLERLTGSY